MGIEIEKKFLLSGSDWKQMAPGTPYRQGYLNSPKERTVRVRTIADKGFLTIKGIGVGASRVEYEYEIPHADAEALLDDLCEKPLILKTPTTWLLQNAWSNFKRQANQYLAAGIEHVIKSHALPNKSRRMLSLGW